MAYSDDAVKAKLSALNETQDSIVSNAQWIMFHRRNADRTASLWLNRLQENTNPAKRLNLIYLANEVVQQSRARSKTDFLLAFEPLIADATASAYKGSSQEIQGKLRRVVEVWRQRGIFDSRIQEQVEKRLDEIDKQKTGKTLGGTGARLGGSLFGSTTSASGVVAELESVNKAYTSLSKAEATSKPAVLTASTEYDKWNDPQAAKLSAPVHAARLRGLVKDLTAAHDALGAKMQAQREIIEGLEKLIASNRASLAQDESSFSDFDAKIADMQSKITEVEDSIMRRKEEGSGIESNAWDSSEPQRPDTEGFTPPPPDVESFTPPANGDDYAEPDNSNGTGLQQEYIGTDLAAEPPQKFNEPPPENEPAAALVQEQAAAAAQDFLKNLMPQIRQASGEIPSTAATGTYGDPRLKRRKIGHGAGEDVDEEIFGAGSIGGVDEDSISAMLGR